MCHKVWVFETQEKPGCRVSLLGGRRRCCCRCQFLRLARLILVMLLLVVGNHLANVRVVSGRDIMRRAVCEYPITWSASLHWLQFPLIPALGAAYGGPGCGNARECSRSKPWE